MFIRQYNDSAISAHQGFHEKGSSAGLRSFELLTSFHSNPPQAPMKSKTTSTANTEKNAKTSTPVKAGKSNGLANKAEKANGPAKPAKENGTLKKSSRQPSASTPRLSQEDTGKRHDIEQLQQLAYFNYLREGCPDDRAMQHWLDAEAQMAGE